MNPNPDPTPAPVPAPGPAPAAPAGPAAEPVVDFIRTQRQNAAYVLLTLAVLFLGVTIWMAVKGLRAGPKAEEPEPAAVDPLNPDEPPTPKTAGDPKRYDYLVGGIGTLLGFLVTAAAGAWLMAGPPGPTEAAQRTEARVAVLAVGGLLGAALIGFGGWYFYRWSGSLTAWLDKGEAKEMRWVVIPLLMVAAGAGLLAAAVQPARAEERNNAAIRRLVYGSNLALSVLLLFVVLVVANVVVGLRVPNRLDTTESGFYSLSDTSREFLAGIEQPVTAYAILSPGGDRETGDIRRLLQTAADVPGTKFKVRFVSPVADKKDLRELAAKYPQVELNETGVLLTVGEDEKRHSFLREDEFTETAPGQRRTSAFVGEARLMRELVFLAENKQRAIVYFTQSAGELDIGGSPGREDVGPASSASRLKAFLERNYLDVRPLAFDPTNPKVPDDASVLVVAEPRSPLSEASVGAIRKYMTETRPDGKKGKLLVLAGARFGPDRKVIRTGLEPLLAEFNIQMLERYVVNEETREFGPEQAIVGFSAAAVRANNPVARTLGEKAVFLAPDWRPVAAVTQSAPGGAAFRAVPLLITVPGRATWLEEEQPTNFNEIVAQLNASAAVRAAKQLSENPRQVGAVASEGDVGRVAVIGNGRLVTDATAERSRSGSAPITFDLVGVTIDWLRDRPSVGIESKKYKEYLFPAAVDETRILWLPLLLTLITVVGLGAGVWVIRRK